MAAHPAKGVLAVRQIPQRRVAKTLRYSENHVSRVLNGREKPSRRFRSQLAAFLDVPEADLFREVD